MAVVLVLEPIFEADLEPEQYAYRANRSALDAVRHVHGLVSAGHTEVVDADLSSYFDEIPHAELLKSLSRRISDRHLLGLIKMWLEGAVEEIDRRGRHHRTTRNKDEGRGSPQGSPLSPLLANLYMRRFVRGWKTLGHERRLKAVIVNYADDLVICCRGDADEAMATMRTMMSKLKLTINEAKTRVCRVPGETFDFLGYTIGRCYSPRTGRSYIGTRPSAKKVASLRDAIREVDRPSLARDECRGPGGPTEPAAAGLVELLLPRPCDAGVPCHRLALLLPAPSVVASEAQGERPGEDTVLRRVPARCAGTGRPECADAEFPVGESVSPCPRAGCVKYARPVR